MDTVFIIIVDESNTKPLKELIKQAQKSIPGIKVDVSFTDAKVKKEGRKK